MTRLGDLTKQDIAHRLPLWTALADLVHHSEPEEPTVRCIACAIRKGGYTLAETESILRYEVAPACWLPPDDGWDFWYDEHVRERMLPRLGKIRLWERTPIWRDLWYAFTFWNFKKAWMRVKAQLVAKGYA